MAHCLSTRAVAERDCAMTCLPAYTVHLDLESSLKKTACLCATCDWSGNAAMLSPVRSCVIAPGRVALIGRCPRCDCLTYMVDFKVEPSAAVADGRLAHSDSFKRYMELLSLDELADTKITPLAWSEMSEVSRDTYLALASSTNADRVEAMRLAGDAHPGTGERGAW